MHSFTPVHRPSTPRASAGPPINRSPDARTHALTHRHIGRNTLYTTYVRVRARCAGHDAPRTCSAGARLCARAPGAIHRCARSRACAHKYTKSPQVVSVRGAPCTHTHTRSCSYLASARAATCAYIFSRYNGQCGLACVRARARVYFGWHISIVITVTMTRILTDRDFKTQPPNKKYMQGLQVVIGLAGLQPAAPHRIAQPSATHAHICLFRSGRVTVIKSDHYHHH